jgi:hypothetical protein
MYPLIGFEQSLIRLRESAGDVSSIPMDIHSYRECPEYLNCSQYPNLDGREKTVQGRILDARSMVFITSGSKGDIDRMHSRFLWQPVNRHEDSEKSQPWLGAS